MATYFWLVLVAVLVPLAAFLVFRNQSHRLPKPVADSRGMALQTIIIIVVLLAIAGAVTGVLLTTAGRTTQEAEGADVTTTIDSETECTTTRLVDSGVGVWSAGMTCTFTASTAGENEMSLSECNLRGGTFAEGTQTGTATCVVSP